MEHSTNGRDFKPFGTVNGNGTTQQTSHYQYQHLQPVNGANYYRVEQVDFDGASAMSEVIVVNIQKEIVIATISPNPFHEQVRLDWSRISADDQAVLIVDILDLLGKKAHTVQLNAADLEATIDLSMLTSGTYFLNFRGENVEIAASRIVKL